MAKFSVLVCGKTGVGKSTLVNAILGEDIAATGGPGSQSYSQEEEPSSSLCPVTADVKSATGNINGVQVTVYDSPGLQDGTRKDDNYLDQIGEVLEKADLVLYCTEMTMTRWLEADQNAIELITKRFGMRLWLKCILVLTKANQFQFSKKYKDQDKIDKWEEKCTKAFNDVAKDFKKQLKNILGSETGSIDSIPVIAAGDNEREPEDRELIFVAPGCKHKDYLSMLWVECYRRLPDDISRLVFLQAAGSGVEISPKMKKETDAIRQSIKRLDEEVGKLRRNETPASRNASPTNIPTEKNEHPRSQSTCHTSKPVKPSDQEATTSAQNVEAGNARSPLTSENKPLDVQQPNTNQEGPKRIIRLDDQQSEGLIDSTNKLIQSLVVQCAARGAQIGARLGLGGGLVSGTIGAAVGAAVGAGLGMGLGFLNKLFSRN